MAVKVVAEMTGKETREEDFVRVRAAPDPQDDTVTLATIERVVERCGDDEEDSNEPGWFVKTLVLQQPMSLDAALGFATLYAERKGIGVVYTAPPGSSDSEPSH